MANWSQTDFTATGELSDMVEIEKIIRAGLNDKEDYFIPGIPKKYLNEEGFVAEEFKAIEIDLRAGYSSMEVIEFYRDENEITLYGAGRWCGPQDFFDGLAEKYKLTGEYVDYENMHDFFIWIQWEDGVKVKDVATAFVSKESIEYRDADSVAREYDWILDEEDWETEYKDVLDAFAEAGVTKEQFMALAVE